MSQYVLLQNPLSISSTTTIKKTDYFIVYNFEMNENTKLILNGRSITKSEAENYEIRYYPNGHVFEKVGEFKTDYTDSLIVGSALAIFLVSAFVLGK